MARGFIHQWSMGLRSWAESLREQGLEWLPIRKWLKGYSFSTLRADARAGLNVSLLDIPQAMAYASMAGLPPQAGIYSSAVSSVAGPAFSSSRYVMLGPTNATSVLVLSAFLTMGIYSQETAMQYIGLLALMVGLMMIVFGFLGAASMVRFVSSSVVTGYITGAALLIIANQLHTLLGFRLQQGRTTFFDVVGESLIRVFDANAPSLLLGLFALILLILLNRLWPKFPNVAVTLLVCSSLEAICEHFIPLWNVEHLSAVEVWKIPFALPHVSWAAISQLASPAIAITILATLEGVSIGKYLAARSGDDLNSDQQILSKGFANCCCAFFSAMPCSGSLTRSVLNFTSGAKTPIASLFSGLVCAVVILSCGPLIGHVPKPVLASLIITVGFSLINFQHIRICLKSTPSDAAVFLVTSISALFFPLDIAVYIGVGLSIALFLRKVSEPQLVEYTFNPQGTLIELGGKIERNDPHISIIHVEGELFFGAADLFRDEIRRVCTDPSLQVVILRLKNAHNLDATSILALDQLVRSLRETGRHLIISGAQRDVIKVLIGSGLIDTIGRKNIFKARPQNPNLSTKQALLRARELMGGKSADIRIFYQPEGENSGGAPTS